MTINSKNSSAYLAQSLKEAEKIEAEMAKRKLREFLRVVWPLFNPGTPFQNNWHLDAMCDHLEAVFRNQIRRLVINLPPRIGKSSVVSVAFPAWCWTNRPEYKAIYSSYAGSLATRDSVSTRSVIMSPWYRRHYGHLFRLTDDTNLKMRFKNDKGGERIASSVNGAILGEGGDLLVADDPNDTKKIESDPIRNETNRWWDEVMSSRLNDPKNGARIIVSQRTHEDDLSGHALATGGYEHLCMPMEYEPSILVNGFDLPTTSLGWNDPRTEPGELLWPERIGEEEVEQFKIDMGSIAYSGQHQQSPTSREGGLFKILWWGEYTTKGFELPADAEVIQCWDTAYKENTRADWSVCQTWARIGNFAYILHVYREKVDFPKLKRAAKMLYERFMPRAVYVENKASGPSLVQELMVDTDIPIILIEPSDGDKVARATSVTPYCEAGRILLPDREILLPEDGVWKDKAWKDLWLHEHTRYPRTAKDDQVDTTVMSIEKLFPRSAAGLLSVYDRNNPSQYSVDRGGRPGYADEDTRVSEADLSYAALTGGRGRGGREDYGLSRGEDLSAFRQVFGRSM